MIVPSCGRALKAITAFWLDSHHAAPLIAALGKGGIKARTTPDSLQCSPALRIASPNGSRVSARIFPRGIV